MRNFVQLENREEVEDYIENIEYNKISSICVKPVKTNEGSKELKYEVIIYGGI